MIFLKIDEAVKLGPALDALIRQLRLGAGRRQRPACPRTWHRLKSVTAGAVAAVPGLAHDDSDGDLFTSSRRCESRRGRLRPLTDPARTRDFYAPQPMPLDQAHGLRQMFAAKPPARAAAWLPTARALFGGADQMTGGGCARAQPRVLVVDAADRARHRLNGAHRPGAACHRAAVGAGGYSRARGLLRALWIRPRHWRAASDAISLPRPRRRPTPKSLTFQPRPTWGRMFMCRLARPMLGSEAAESIEHTLRRCKLAGPALPA